MSENANSITRRIFLKVGGGLAIFGAGPLWDSNGRTALYAAARKSPGDAVVLRSRTLAMVLDRKSGLPWQYELSEGNIRFRGEDQGVPVSSLICIEGSWDFRNVAPTVNLLRSTEAQADFVFEVRADAQRAAGFTLRYVLADSTVHVSMENVHESEGCQLIQVDLPRLVTISDEDGEAWLAHGDSGGSLALLKQAIPGRLKPNTFWGNVHASLPVVMIGNHNALCVQEVTSYMDETVLAVEEESGHRRASLGTNKIHRVNGSSSYDMNTGPGTPRIAGTRTTPNLLVGQKSACRLDFVTTKTDTPWLEGAKLVRSRMPARPTRYYDNKLIYGIHCDEPKWEKPGATFEECEELIQNVAMLTDGCPQVVHLWGWQYRGKDTGYPAVAEVDKRVGTYDGLMGLMARARKSNCTVTFSDNYDDGYRTSPAWDPKFIARRPDGELWESRNWTGENSYIIGLAKYMKGPGAERVRYTCERYRLRETTHVDVLSYYSIRNDWDHAFPASGVKNLAEGRYKILEEFARHGVDVSSEALRYAFIGRITYFWHMPTPAPCPFGGEPIPLLATIYRQSALWGEAGRNKDFLDRAFQMLFHNACPHISISNHTAPSEITDFFYLLMIPWFKLHSRDVEGFRREGDKTLLTLAGGSLVELDWRNRNYRIVVDGVEIARDGSTFCSLDGERLAFYSTTKKDLSAPLPASWSTNNVTARAFTAEGPREVAAVIRDGLLTVAVPAQQPVIVNRGRGSV